MIILSMYHLKNLDLRLLAVLILFSTSTVFAQESDEKIELFLKEGDEFFESANYEKAISSYDKVLEIDPAHIEALAKTGDALAKLDKIDKATSYLFEVLDIDPNYSDEQGNLYIDKFLELDPDNLEILYLKAKSILIYYDMLDDALSYLDKILEINPNHADALYSKGEVYFQQDQFEDAIVFYDKALEIKPDHAAALSGKGYALAKLGDFESSDDFLKRAIEMEPDNPDVLYKKGSSLMVQGNGEDALTYFYDALKIEPNHYLSEVKMKLIALIIPYKEFDGFVDTLIYDSQGTLVGHLKVRDLWYLDHEIFNKTVADWPVTKVINRDGKDYEVLQQTDEYEIPYRNWEGGVFQYGVYFPEPDSEFDIVKTTHWLYHVEEGDRVKVIRTYFRPV